MLNITFTSPVSEIQNISNFENDVFGKENKHVRDAERYLGIGNSSKQMMILFTMLLCASFKIDMDRGYRTTFEEYNSIYNFNNIDRSLQYHGLSLNNFFRYFNLFS